MKKILFACVLLFNAGIAYGDDDCPSAADAAESQNQNAYKHCDYSKTGLNGVLHKAFSSATDETKEDKNTLSKDVTEKNQSPVDKTQLMSVSEFSSAQQLPSVKFVLLEKLSLECTKGFVVEGERYLPTSNKAMKLELIYRCL